MANRIHLERISGAKVAVIDGGGRGDALVKKYAASPEVGIVFAFPGNDWMKVDAIKPVEILPVATVDVKNIVEMCLMLKVDLVDVCQDDAVAAGLVNALRTAGLRTIGPTQESGEIEWNKIFARQLGVRAELPQPVWQAFNSPESGFQYISAHPSTKFFVKFPGLAAGKGALPVRNVEEGRQAIQTMKNFGDSQAYLIENWLGAREGETAEEFSMFAICDGEHFQVIAKPVQDHKRVRVFDEGEQTGGTGVSSPALAVNEEVIPQIYDIFRKTFAQLQVEDRPYTGVLYLGGMIVKSETDPNNQKVYIVEFNARWGDPEAQVLMPAIQNDLFQLSTAVVEGNLDCTPINVDNKARIGVAAMAKGYPVDASRVKGKRIYGLDKVRKLPGIQVYGAGMKVADNKEFINGGRLFTLVAEGENVLEAQQKALAAMAFIHGEDNSIHYRTDIGWRDANTLLKMLAGGNHR